MFFNVAIRLLRELAALISDTEMRIFLLRVRTITRKEQLRWQILDLYEWKSVLLGLQEHDLGT